MQIIKVGGVIVSGPNDLAKIIGQINTNQKTVLIFSAFGKTTQIIKDLVKLASSEEGDYSQIFFDLKQFYQQFCYTKQYRNELSNHFLSFQKMLNSIQILGECPPKTLDYLLSYGELLSGSAFTHYLIKKNIDVKLFDFKGLIKTDSNYNQANVLLEESKTNINIIKPELIPGINLIAGFVSTDIHGNITTMGFESSNLSAVVFAIGFQEDNLSFISDVNCIYSFDPKKYSKAIPLKNLSYKTAFVAAKIGIKILTFKMMELALKHQIKIEFSGLNSNHKTLISNNSQDSFIIIREQSRFIICGKSFDYLKRIASIDKVKKINFEKKHRLELYSDGDILEELHKILFSEN